MPYADNKSINVLAAMSADRALPLLSKVLLWLAYQAAVWVERARSRKHLAELDTHLLRDIGLTREQANQESVKRFWMP